MQINVVLLSCWLAFAASSILGGLNITDPNSLVSDTTGKGRSMLGNLGYAMLGVGAGMTMKTVYDQGGLNWRGAAGNGTLNSGITPLVTSTTEAPTTATAAPTDSTTTAAPAAK